MSHTIIDPRSCQHPLLYVKGDPVKGIYDKGVASCPQCDRDFDYVSVPDGIRLGKEAYAAKGVSDTGNRIMKLHQFEKRSS